MVIFALIAIIAVLVGVIVTLNIEIESLKDDVHYYTIENHRFIVKQVHDEHQINCIIKQAQRWKRKYIASMHQLDLLTQSRYTSRFLDTLKGILKGEDTNAV